MVPPALNPPDQQQHGTSAAVEYAVRGLGVEHIVILGHALCGGIAALVDGDKGAFADFEYLSTWTAIAQDVRDLAVDRLKGRPKEDIVRAVEQAAVVNSVQNLMSFPWLAERVTAGTLVLHAWWFNLTKGQLYAFNPKALAFEPVLGISLEPTVGKVTPLSAIKPERFIEAIAGRPTSF